MYFYVSLYTVFPYHSIVLTSEDGCVTKSHGLGGNGGDTQSLSVVITIFGESNLPTTLVLKNKCPAHHAEVAFSTSMDIVGGLFSP